MPATGCIQSTLAGIFIALYPLVGSQGKRNFVELNAT
jgi:hypothetical protein